METVYSRLSSALDVFESLCFTLWRVLCGCQNRVPAGTAKLDANQIHGRVDKFIAERYSKAFDKYERTGQALNIPLHSLRETLEEAFQGVVPFKAYSNHSGSIRQLRNAIIHDVRLGRVQMGEKTLVPKPASASKYRSWSAVHQASAFPRQMQSDFVEPQPQAATDFSQTAELLNTLYGHLLSAFQNEFWATERSSLREMFQLEFGNPADNPLPALQTSGSPLAVSNKQSSWASRLGVSLTAQAVLIDLQAGSNPPSDTTAVSGDVLRPSPSL